MWMIDRLANSRLETYTRLTINPQYSVTLLAVQKLRVLLVFITRSIFEWRVLRKAHHQTKKIKGAYSDKDALVIAGGPSVNRLIVENVLQDQQSGQLDVFAVNSYAEGEIASRLIPDYFGLSDPIHKPNSNVVFKGVNSQDIWAKLESWPQTKLLLPHNWLNLKMYITNEVAVWFDDRDLPGWLRSNSPIRPRGYSSNTGLKAVACAMFMGYRNVFVIGLDNSLAKTIEVDSDNRLMEASSHFYDSESTIKEYRPHLYPRGVQDLLYDQSLSFVDLRKCFKSKNLFNIDTESLTDVLPKIASCYVTELSLR